MSTAMPSDLVECRNQGHAVSCLRWPLSAPASWSCQHPNCMKNIIHPELSLDLSLVADMLYEQDALEELKSKNTLDIELGHLVAP